MDHVGIQPPHTTVVAPYFSAASTVVGLVGVPATRSPVDLLRWLARWDITWLTCFDWGSLVGMAALTAPAAVVLDPGVAAFGLSGLVMALRGSSACPVYVVRGSGDTDLRACGADAVLEVGDPAVGLDSLPVAPRVTPPPSGEGNWLSDGLDGNEGQMRWLALRLDRRGHTAYWHDRMLPISDLQFRMLWALSRAQGGVVEFADLSRAIYGKRAGSDRGRIHAHVLRVRKLIEACPAEPKFLLTVWGRGFRLTDRD